MKIKTSELQGAALDWAVAKCEGEEIEYFNPLCSFGVAVVSVIHGMYSPSTYWSQGGPFIEREMISIEWTGENWMAYIFHDEECFGPTPLIAAMQCYVASKMGDEVEVPNEMEV